MGLTSLSKEKSMSLSLSDRFAMAVGKVVIGVATLWVATSVLRPLVRNINISVSFDPKEAKSGE
jgi:hypothetical protein